MLATHMAVFYETTNVIDIYIKDKPTCSSWNSGNAAVGIQNDAGTTAFVLARRKKQSSVSQGHGFFVFVTGHEGLLERTRQDCGVHGVISMHIDATLISVQS